MPLAQRRCLNVTSLLEPKTQGRRLSVRAQRPSRQVSSGGRAPLLPFPSLGSQKSNPLSRFLEAEAVLVLQYVNASNQHVHLNPTRYYVNHISKKGFKPSLRTGLLEVLVLRTDG